MSLIIPLQRKPSNESSGPTTRSSTSKSASNLSCVSGAKGASRPSGVSGQSSSSSNSTSASSGGSAGSGSAGGSGTRRGSDAWSAQEETLYRLLAYCYGKEAYCAIAEGVKTKTCTQVFSFATRPLAGAPGTSGTCGTSGAPLGLPNERDEQTEDVAARQAEDDIDIREVLYTDDSTDKEAKNSCRRKKRTKLEYAHTLTPPFLPNSPPCLPPFLYLWHASFSHLPLISFIFRFFEHLRKFDQPPKYSHRENFIVLNVSTLAQIQVVTVYLLSRCEAKMGLFPFLLR